MIDSVYRKSTNGTIFILNLRHIISRPPGNGAVIRSFSSSRIGSGRVAILTFTKLAKRQFDSCKDFFNIANKFLKKLYQNVARKTVFQLFTGYLWSGKSKEAGLFYALYVQHLFCVTLWHTWPWMCTLLCVHSRRTGKWKSGKMFSMPQRNMLSTINNQRKRKADEEMDQSEDEIDVISGKNF